jgi:hypothetical protein
MLVASFSYFDQRRPSEDEWQQSFAPIHVIRLPENAACKQTSIPIPKSIEEQGEGGLRLSTTGIVKVIAWERLAPVFEYAHEFPGLQMRLDLPLG